jgi:hypothetical protein
MTAEQINLKMDMIMDILESDDMLLSDAVALLEMIKFNLMMAIQQDSRGTLQ